jgi:phosphate transport system protein
VNKHILHRYDAELGELTDRLLAMADTTRTMIHDAVEALRHADSKLAREVIARDRDVDQFDTDIDQQCVDLIARRQPMGSDLRYLIGVIEMVTDLERIGDEAKNIAERVLILNEMDPLKPYIDLPSMAATVETMVHDALDCLVRRDSESALAVVRADDGIDDLHDQVQRELLTYMLEDPHTITRALHLTFISTHLERIADHATNIAEVTYFLVEGRNIRHTSGLRKSRAAEA